MNGYIRGIERTAAYARAYPVNRYAAYRLTTFEQTAPVPPQWSMKTYREASKSAFAWLREAGHGQKLLNDMMERLGRNGGLSSKDCLNASLQTLVGAINRWETAYREHERLLRPEIWEAMELALRHPAMEELGIRRKTAESGIRLSFEWESAFRTDPTDNRKETLRRQLLGSEGLFMDLKRALSYAEQFPPVDLLRLPFASAYPYAYYYGASQAYWPLPLRGAIMNKYV